MSILPTSPKPQESIDYPFTPNAYDKNCESRPDFQEPLSAAINKIAVPYLLHGNLIKRVITPKTESKSALYFSAFCFQANIKPAPMRRAFTVQPTAAEIEKYRQQLINHKP